MVEQLLPKENLTWEQVDEKFDEIIPPEMRGGGYRVPENLIEWHKIGEIYKLLDEKIILADEILEKGDQEKLDRDFEEEVEKDGERKKITTTRRISIVDSRDRLLEIKRKLQQSFGVYEVEQEVEEGESGK